MRKIYKTLSIFLLAVLLLNMTACNTKSPADETPSTSSPVTDAPLEYKLTVTEGQETEFSIINEEDLSENKSTLVLSFNSRIRALTGAAFQRNTDKIYDPETISDTYEILIGAADRDESREVYDSIGFDGYAVKLVGKKIVIAAYTYENMKLAIDAFFNEAVTLVTEDGKSSLKYVKDFVHTGTDGVLFTKENPLSEYKLVYGADSASIASRLSIAIEERTGIDLDMVRDTEPASEHEIILGKTSRPESSMVEADDQHYYRVKTFGKKVVIQSISYVSTYAIIDAILNDFMSYSHSLNFPANADERILKYSGEDRKDITEGADIRVMSFNILNEKWATDHDPYPRLSGIVGCVNYYKPDVIGFQEISEKWYDLLIPLFPDYEFVNSEVNGKPNLAYTVLAYKKETVNLVIGSVYVYSKCTNNRLRILSLGVFEHKETGNDFIVTSTHLDVNYEDHRDVQSEEHRETVERFIKAYKCPVISTGDYNSREGSQPHINLTYTGVLKYAKEDAVEKGMICDTIHSLGVKPSMNKTSIDQIFYTEGVTPLYYTTIVDKFVLASSDHTPLICDFKFN